MPNLAQYVLGVVCGGAGGGVVVVVVIRVRIRVRVRNRIRIRIRLVSNRWEKKTSSVKLYVQIKYL